ncbi:hypothetical protein C8F01DRAFT_1295743 [Mycena amicta]|nr:hypothetical protein C8F01DRAFT_1295743 [Mycena amicta]
MDSHFDLPNELWTEVFQDLHPSILVCVHCVSRRFYAISHPILFRSLVLDPDRHAAVGNRDFLGMLHVYTAPHIRKYVRSLSVSFQFGRLTRSQRVPDGVGTSTSLIDPMFQSIPRFTSLRVLECTFRANWTVDLTNLGLHALPMLDKLMISGCSLLCPVDPLPSDKRIRVAHFAYTAIPGMSHQPAQHRAGQESVGSRSFLSSLEPTCLRELTLHPTFDVSPGAWLALDQDLYSSFTALRKVDITCDGPFLGPIRTFLSALPALQDIVLHGAFRNVRDVTLDTPVSWDSNVSANETIMRQVRTYTGPTEYLSVLPVPALTSLTLTSANCFCEVNALLGRVSTSTVKHLSLLLPLGHVHEWIDTSQEQEEPVRKFFSSNFPRLESLHLRASDNACDDEEMLVAFEVLLGEVEEDVPSALISILRAASESESEHIRLRHAVVEWNIAPATAAALPDLAGLLDRLVHAAPRVLELEFEGSAGQLGTDRAAPVAFAKGGKAETRLVHLLHDHLIQPAFKLQASSRARNLRDDHPLISYKNAANPPSSSSRAKLVQYPSRRASRGLQTCRIKPWISIADEFHRQTHWHRISLATSRSRPTERPEPRLPLDLEREIFELTAHLYPETRPRLLLVARRVRCWLEPLLYKTLVVDGLHEAHRIVSLATTKPPGFFAGITRRLVLSADSHTPTQILALCKGVTHLAIEDDILREQWQCIHPFFFSLEHVQRLAFAARELRTFDPTAPVFSHLTHLTLLDCSYDKLPPFVSALPSLTHLALFHPPTCSIVQDLLADCPHLRLMVLIAPSRHWAVVAAGSTPRPRTLTDERLVICVSKDWKEGVGEGYTYWDVAEIFLRDKQRGAVDG